METIEQINEYFGVDVTSLVGKSVQVLPVGYEEKLEGEFLGIEKDPYGDYYVVLRIDGNPVLEGVHPSRVTINIG